MANLNNKTRRGETAHMDKVKVTRFSENLWQESTTKALTLLAEGDVKAGLLTLKPGDRLPPEGFSVHEDQDEIALIIEGELYLVTSDGQEYKLSKECLIFNPRGTLHYVINRGEVPCRIFWILVKAG